MVSKEKERLEQPSNVEDEAESVQAAIEAKNRAVEETIKLIASRAPSAGKRRTRK